MNLLTKILTGQVYPAVIHPVSTHLVHPVAFAVVIAALAIYVAQLVALRPRS